LNLVADEGVDRFVVKRLRQTHMGVILIRLAGLENSSKADVVSEVCGSRAAELIGAFSVGSRGQVRIRPRS
jgi:hypothetical protein